MAAISSTPHPAACLNSFGLPESATQPSKPVTATETDLHVARFERELLQLNLRNARLGAWIVMVLVPLCAILDWLAYPQHFGQFFLLRIACSVSCIPLLLALDNPASGRYHRLYPVVLPLLPAVIICAMIYLSGDAGSPYYAGLCLCLVGTAFVFHWTFREIGITVGVVLACYLAATVPNLHVNGGVQAVGLFINNTLFILLTCAILYLGSRQHHAIRRREFANRCQVEAQREELRLRNEELTCTLQRLRETEAQLTRSEKLASIGRLSAGIIHEINNPLNFVKMAVHVLREKARIMPPDLAESVGAIAADINEGVDRVGTIVSDLRSFAHPETRVAGPVELNQPVGKALRLLSNEIDDRHAELHWALPEHAVALGDENLISQVVLNLVQNSLDALAGRDTPRIDIRAACGNGQVELVIRDNGTGIPEEHLKHIFDPFFTTKDVGQGMGLGLSLCYRMMQQMSGDIEVRSDGGSYTEVKLIFRQAERPA